MSKSNHPQHLTIRMLAMRLERDALNAEEKALVARALRAMANGGSFEEALGVERPQGRPENDRALYGVQWVATLMLEPSGALYGDMGGEGLTKAAAIEWVAGKLSISPDTLDTAYKSKRGQVVRKQVADTYQVLLKQVAEGGGGQ